MSGSRNTQIRLASRPSGWVTEDNFAVTDATVPEVADGQLLIRNIFMSVDPYMRGRMNDTKSYVPPFQKSFRRALSGKLSRARTSITRKAIT
jgi:NADPH-dependent curcumin reductase CurA